VGLLGQATVKLFASGFYALRDTRTPATIAALSLALSTGLALALMPRFGPAGIALGSSLGSTVNVVFHLRDLDRRIGPILGFGEWRAVGTSAVAAAVAALGGVGAASLTTGVGPVPRALLVVAIFGGVYAALALALKHPDAARLWKLRN
jgi:putative peptidoglycan lipid II flippase